MTTSYGPPLYPCDLKLHRDLETLALRLTGNAHASREFPYEEWTPADVGDHEYTIWYLGGGYWRARVWRESQTHSVVRVTLINPDRTHEEIATVQAAMRILHVLPGL